MELFVKMAVIRWAMFFGVTMLLIASGKEIREKTAWCIRHMDTSVPFDIHL